jgi:tellurite resistance protein TerC
MDLSAVGIVIQLIFLEGVLSIDNAAVLGAMVAHLPTDQPIPWPRPLQFLAGWSARVLGPQRQAALKVGLLGAYLGRALMLVIAGALIHNPWVRILGSSYLVYLATEHFAGMYHAMRGETGAHYDGSNGRALGGFWATVAAIELADLAFSVDNVVAAVALSNELWVVMLGVAIGIVIMRFAATIFTRMIAWEPAMSSGAYLLLFAIGVELLLEEFAHLEVGEFAQFAISAGILVLTIAVARLRWLRWVPRALRPVLALFAFVAAVIQRIIIGLTFPFRALRRGPTSR